jgi:hypothetical protein
VVADSGPGTSLPPDISNELKNVRQRTVDTWDHVETYTDTVGPTQTQTFPACTPFCSMSTTKQKQQLVATCGDGRLALPLFRDCTKVSTISVDGAYKANGLVCDSPYKQLGKHPYG